MSCVGHERMVMSRKWQEEMRQEKSPTTRATVLLGLVPIYLPLREEGLAAQNHRCVCPLERHSQFLEKVFHGNALRCRTLTGKRSCNAGEVMDSLRMPGPQGFNR